MTSAATPSGITVRQLREAELSAADRIFRLAFGTFLGLPDPLRFSGDADYVRTRFRAQPEAAFAAEIGGELAGSNFVTRWGSVAFFGPLTILPSLWDRGVGQRLLEPVIDCFARWGTTHAGLFTFPHSPKHIHVYQKYGFWPRFLTAVTSKPVVKPVSGRGGVRYSELRNQEPAAAAADCRALTDSIFDGLDVTTEIASVAIQALGDTVLSYDSSRLSGFAICHCGPGTEAGSGACYVKFAAVRSGKNARHDLGRLLDLCEQLAFDHGLKRLVAGMNLARTGAFQTLADRGFRAELWGVAMNRPNEPGYNRPDAYIIDDWR